jgi:PAS domain S-box-containing protein
MAGGAPLGGEPEPAFAAIAAMAARLGGTPLAAITFVDSEREWVKAAHGGALPHVARGVSLGGRVLERNAPLVVADVAADPGLRANPWVANGVRFYAGVPIGTGDGPVGALAVLGRDPRSAGDGLLDALRDAAAAVVPHLQHQHIFDVAPIAMAIVNTEGRITRVNAAYCELLGYSREELLNGPHVRELLHPDEVANAERLLGQVIEDGTKVSLVAAHVHKDGHVLRLRAAASRLTDGDGQRFLLASLEDVTDELRIAEELRRAREGAERANRAKSEFLSRMSHELRTPLNAVLGFAQLLESEELGPAEHESVGRILRGGYHLLNLVNDMLDISAIESGQLPMTIERVSATDAIADTLELIRPLADERAIRLGADLPGTELALAANERRLKQVLLNLISNAIKYSPVGADVTVQADRIDDARARIDVVDTGPGIAPDQLERVFVPFARVGTSGTAEGTGLGLALSRGLVEGMGGTLTVQSSPAGSRFTVELREAGSAATPAQQAPAADARVRRVIYIEANESNVQVVDGLCRRRGDIELHSTMRGDAGLELAHRLVPDVVIVDLHLPDMPGEDVVRELRADDTLRDTAVIVLTADVTQDREQRLREAGASAYLTKPVDLGRLQDELDRALGQR